MSNIICIDPGHGGRDPGGGSNGHFKEKDMVLKISKEMKNHFERNGVKVVMTRTSNKYLGSVARTNKVKKSGAKYCISNHINAGGGEGAETIHSIYSDGKLAEGILKVLVNAGAKYRRFFSKKGNNGDYYYMHRMTGSVKTIIVEHGFADNKSDTDKILKDWKKYAEVVAKYYIEHVFNKKYIAPGHQHKPGKPSKSIDQLAQEVIDGKHGTGSARKKALGSKYAAVQKRVNEILLGNKPNKSIAQMADEVIKGKHGNGHVTRRKSLGISKSEYEKVRKEVNRRL